MSLTKKHFEELAAILAEHRIETVAGRCGRGPGLMADIIEFCQRHNPNFDVERFTARIEELTR